jgi:thiamine biosynthesis protein ThiS
MKIKVNGENIEISDPLTINGLLKHIGLDDRRVAIERNLEIVPKSNYSVTNIADGDQIEIVHFIGGGNLNVNFIAGE